MNIHVFEPQISVSIEIVERQLIAYPISVVLQPGSDKPVPGLPGKTAGSLVLVKENTNFTLLVSTGLPGKANAESFRCAGGAIARWLVDNKVSEASLKVTNLDPQGVNNAVEALCEGLWLGAYQFKKYKKTEDTPVSTLYLEIGKNAQSLKTRLEKVQKLAYATNLARQIIHEPANIINPQTLAELAGDLAKKFGFKCTVIDTLQLEAMKAGALLAVGQGSKTPSCLIVLEYTGQDPDPDAAPVVMVGKAITFDTGGYSLKGVDHIVGMKFDKSGGVAVLCSLVAAASLKLKQPVIGIIPAAENMVSEKAYRPDDILISLS
jgi:leucyl aminopeptidase